MDCGPSDCMSFIPHDSIVYLLSQLLHVPRIQLWFEWPFEYQGICLQPHAGLSIFECRHQHKVLTFRSFCSWLE
ncbi:hypothetical protein STEG23_010525 [Scotinomys teguina]